MNRDEAFEIAKESFGYEPFARGIGPVRRKFFLMGFTQGKKAGNFELQRKLKIATNALEKLSKVEDENGNVLGSLECMGIADKALEEIG